MIPQAGQEDYVEHAHRPGGDACDFGADLGGVGERCSDQVRYPCGGGDRDGEGDLEGEA